MKIEEHVTLQDGEQSVTRFRGTITRGGRSGRFDIAAKDWASNEKLGAAVYNDGPPGVDIVADVNQLGRAVTNVSEPAVRVATTDTGWTEDSTKFLVPGGHVDRDGYHEYHPDAGVPEADLGGFESARRLGLRRLSPEETMQLKWHVAEELIDVHERPVMRAVLGAVALAPLIRLVGVDSHPAIWLKGPTGCGKTFAATLAVSFFGDYPEGGSGRLLTWISTGNFLQSAGYYHRDCLYFIDDFKLDSARHAEVVRLLQNYADGSGRGRLRADATMNFSRPIRGLLMSTGEDFPIQNASGRARSIVIPIATGERDGALGSRCREMSRHYRGLMADFLAWAIREWRRAPFVERVEHWRTRYHAELRGQPNAPRIASNHALLAAAFELFADYLSDEWPGAKEEARIFAEVDVVELIAQAAGEVREDQPSEVFLATLGELFRAKQVCVQEADSRKRNKTGAVVVGRYGGSHPGLHDETAIDLSMEMALAAVQESLRKQNRPPLATSVKELIAQLAASGHLLGEDNRPLDPEARGLKTHQVSLARKRSRCVRMRMDTICPARQTVSGHADD